MVQSKRVQIMYRTADQVSRVKNELAGSFMYFARAEDAMETGLFCQKLVVPFWGDEDKFDFLDKRFEVKNTNNLSPTEQSLLVNS
ncbi:hypothetical protein AB7W67_07385 [Providencia rettgeri]|nr:hypothetical protein [Providencia rettgeri]